MVFSLGSIIATIVFGVAIGNVINGFPIYANHEYAGNILDLISPYTILTGLFNLTLFSLHGAMYLIIKTEGELQARIKKIAFNLFGVFFTFYAIVTFVTLLKHPDMLANFSFGKISQDILHPMIDKNQYLISSISWTVVVLNMLAIANIPRCLIKGLEVQGFVSSASTILAVVLFFALGMFPKMLISSIDPLGSFTIYNGASSLYTLKTMFWVAIWGMPFVIGYTTIIYWTFRGKTKLNSQSY